MCGILGAIGLKEKIDEAVFERSLHRLTHRGPDQWGIWTDDTGKEGEIVSLGSRRLAIYDTSENARQPMHYQHLVITYNGAIYNHKEIRKTLETKGHVFKTTADTEVILAAFLEWGEKCVDRFNGMWAFAIWDTKNKELFLSRDRFGQKPLFYYQGKNLFVFASEMKAIVPLMGSFDYKESCINASVIPDLVFDYESWDIALINGIRRFPAGRSAWLEGDELIQKKHWCTLDHLQDVPESYEAQVDKFSELFLDAIKLRTTADVPVSATLSGGVDSSSVVAGLHYLKNTIAHDVSACTVSFPGTPHDEQGFAKELTTGLGIEHHINHVNAEDTLATFAESIYLFEEVYLTAPAPLMEAYRTIRSKNIKVSLDGHGADELFCGYDSFFFKRFADIPFSPKKINEVLDIYRNMYPHQPPQLTRQKVGLLNFFKSNIYELLITDFQLNPLKHKYKHELRELGAFGRGLYTLFHFTILPTLLRNYDRYSMAHGVEVRMPFMDHRLVSYVFSLPAESKLRNGFTKAILRDSVKKYLPDNVALRKTKMGFQTPVIDWARGAWKPLLQDLVSSDDFNRSVCINPKRVKKRMQRLFDDNSLTYKAAEQIWLEFSPFLWEKYFLKRLQKDG